MQNKKIVAALLDPTRIEQASESPSSGEDIRDDIEHSHIFSDLPDEENEWNETERSASPAEEENSNRFDNPGVDESDLSGRKQYLVGLENKYRNRTLRKDPSVVQEIYTHHFTPRIDKELTEFPITAEEKAEMTSFAKEQDDIGLYLISNYIPQDKRFSWGAFDAKTLADFVNNLPFTPKKICIVSCKFSNSEDQEKGIKEFLKHLDVYPPPVVASYSYLVYPGKTTGKKEYDLAGSNDNDDEFDLMAEPERLTKEQLAEKGNQYALHRKNYFVHDPVLGEFREDDQHVYTDKEGPFKENARVVNLRLGDALGQSGQIKVRPPANGNRKVLYVGAENVYVESGKPKIALRIPHSKLRGMNVADIKAHQILGLNVKQDEIVDITLVADRKIQQPPIRGRVEPYQEGREKNAEREGQQQSQSRMPQGTSVTTPQVKEEVRGVWEGETFVGRVKEKKGDIVYFEQIKAESDKPQSSTTKGVKIIRAVKGNILNSEVTVGREYIINFLKPKEEIVPDTLPAVPAEIAKQQEVQTQKFAQGDSSAFKFVSRDWLKGAIWEQLKENERLLLVEALRKSLPDKDKLKNKDKIDIQDISLDAAIPKAQFEKRTPLLVDSRQRAYYYTPGATQQSAKIAVVTLSRRGGEHLTHGAETTIHCDLTHEQRKILHEGHGGQQT